MLGKSDAEFYICARDFNISKGYDSYGIAESQVDCINNNLLGWVPSALIILGTDKYEGFTTLIPPEFKQCENLIDDDRDGEIDYPSDLGCESPSDDREDEAPIVQPPPPVNPKEIIRIISPDDGFKKNCPKGDTCPVSVRIRWYDATKGNKLCVFVQPLQTPNQPYYFQFQGNRRAGMDWTGSQWYGFQNYSCFNFWRMF